MKELGTEGGREKDGEREENTFDSFCCSFFAFAVRYYELKLVTQERLSVRG